MNWRELTIPDFLNWLSLEGLDGLDLVNEEYEQLPWTLRVALWRFMQGTCFLPEFSRDWPMDRSDDFGSLLGNRGYRHGDDPHPRADVEMWLEDHYLDVAANIQGAEVAKREAELRVMFEKIMAGDTVAINAMETAWQEYQKVEPAKDYKGVAWYEEKGLTESDLEALGEEGWNALWEKHGPMFLIFNHKDVPASCLDKWIESMTLERDTQMGVLSCYIMTRNRKIPAHWIPRILASNDLLPVYLRRDDVPDEIRKPFRSHPDAQVRIAAWMEGSYEDEELVSLRPNDWAPLHSRPGIGMEMARGIMEHQPRVTDRWGPSNVSREVRLMVAEAGYLLDWEEENDPEVLMAGIRNGKTLSWSHMANVARRSWGKEVLENLALRVAEVPDGNAWQVKRLFNLGGFGPTKPLIKALMASPSRELRVLATTLMGSQAIGQAKAGQSTDTDKGEKGPKIAR